jgi:hypothetical protein
MITRTERPYQSNRIFRIALVVSLLVHLVLGFLVYESNADLRRVIARLDVRPTPQPDEVVSLSTALKIERRAKPKPQSHVVRVAVRRPQRPTPQRLPHPQSVPVAVAVTRPVVVKRPVPPAPSRALHEIAKLAPHAAPQPPKTIRETVATTTPTAPPATPKTEKVVASLEHPSAVTAPERPTHPTRAAKSAQFSQAQLAQIQRDLAKTIVQARVENNPLSNVSRPVTVAAATRRYSVDFAALSGDMREAQGLCDPIRSWHADGWDYYYAMCTVQEPDGTTSRKPMPWPVRWRPRNDPWGGYYRIATGPMPLPPPGWHPDRPIDPDFAEYLRKNGYSM